MDKPERLEDNHRENGECGCKYLEDEYPCEIEARSYNQAYDDWKKYIDNLRWHLDNVFDGLTKGSKPYCDEFSPPVIELKKVLEKLNKID